ncbi:MAG: hypothetical protein EHM23_19650 [Acidobacteria bacterium]|nr:MAG: hypothetical protein EHM23_19650 [Acidobacteriota bacterium]
MLILLLLSFLLYGSDQGQTATPGNPTYQAPGKSGSTPPPQLYLAPEAGEETVPECCGPEPPPPPPPPPTR